MTGTLFVVTASGNEREIEVEYYVEPGEKATQLEPGCGPSVVVEEVWLLHKRRDGQYSRRRVSSAVISSDHETQLLEQAGEHLEYMKQEAAEARMIARRCGWL